MRNNALLLLLLAGSLSGCAAPTRQQQAEAPANVNTGTLDLRAAAQGGNPPPATQGQAPQVPVATNAPAPPAAPAAAPQSTTGLGELKMIPARLGDGEALAFQVPFQADKTSVRLSPDAERTLTAIALRADRVQLRESFEGGRMADFAPELRDERLRSTRAFLVERGVPANRIEIAKPAPRPAMKPGSAGPDERGPVVEVVLQLPEPGGRAR